VKRWRISREDQDQLAYESHMKASAAWRDGFYSDLLLTLPASKSTTTSARIRLREKLAKLRPTFDSQSGTLTAGNSTPLTDGASAVLLASEEWAAKRSLPVLAYLSFGKAWAWTMRAAMKDC